MTTPTYNPAEIEQQTQAYWLEQQSFEVKEDITKEKYYCLSMLPYPSGELHMGHVRNYTIGDVISRYQMMLGKNVLQPMGWDAFGLPAENAALKHQVAPSVWTYKNIDQMRKQLMKLGFAIDWKREVTTCQPSFYRWEQWLFTKLFKKGLAYKKNSVVNWDPVDQTVLANEQVVDGRGWRSGALVERKEISQWFFKITSYADELLQGLEILDGWPEQVRTMQRNWIGRSEGVEITFDVSESKEPLKVYTTRPDTLLGATYLAIAPEHPLAQRAGQDNDKVAAFIQSCQNIKVSEAELATLEKRGMDTGFKAKHPLTGAFIPIWVANYVLMEYGSGAVMAVPAHDARDFEFAQYYHLPMHIVIKPADGTEWDFASKAFTEAGIMVDSREYTGLHSPAAKEAIIEKLVSLQKGTRKINYRLRDWGVSRQRYWGTPIPIIYCDACGAVPVPEQDLPVVLPENIVLHEPSSPLKQLESFYQTTCPQCGSPATRETDTFDTFVESSWYYARYTCNDQNKSMLDDRVRYWTPVDQYIGGIEHAVMHLLYARFFHKILRDEGLVDSDEPFIRLLTQGMVLKDGAKMSKSKGNTVSPELLIEQYGVDTARLFSMFAAPPDQSLEWSDSGVEGAHRFLKRLWTYAQSSKEIIQDHLLRKERQDWKSLNTEQQNIRREIHEVLQQANQDMERQQFNTVVSAAMKIFNILGKIETASEIDIALMSEGLSILLRVLSPITPHICHTLWRDLGYGDDILYAGWPKADHKAMKTSTMTLVIQVNGKLRSQITVDAEADQQKIEELAQQDPQVLRSIDNKPIKKIIVVPKKLVNIVV